MIAQTILLTIILYVAAMLSAVGLLGVVAGVIG
jgi:hypothetical protein